MTLGRSSWIASHQVKQAPCFLAVGGSGLIVDILAFGALSAFFTMGVARAAAIGTAMSWNFALNRLITFRQSNPASLLIQYVRFCSACIVGAIFNWGASLLLLNLSDWFSQHLSLTAATGAVVGAGANYALCCRWVFRTGERMEPECRDTKISTADDRKWKRAA